MEWSAAKHRDYPELRSFIEAREWSAVNFADRFRREFTERKKINRKSRIYIGREHGYIRSCLYVNYHGLILPVCSDDPDLPGIDRVTARHAITNPHSIMGESNCVEKTCTHLALSPKVTVAYYTMNSDCTPNPQGLSENGLVVQKASVRDASALMPLQKSYELEEVLIDPSRYSPTTSFLLLQRALKTQTVFIARKHGNVVGKAGTNAVGFGYWQVGGVFTVPDERNQGIARVLMEHLMQACRSENKQISLFVKKTNTAAITLYQNLGFAIMGDFTISYFEHG